MDLPNDIRRGLPYWMKKYKRAGSPFGEGEEGLLRWMRERVGKGRERREEVSLTDEACERRAIEAMKQFVKANDLMIVGTPEGLQVGKRVEIEQPYCEAGSPFGPDGVLLWYQFGRQARTN